MIDTASDRSRAIELMRRAMTMLETSDHAQATLHLGRAIDAAERPPFLDLESLGLRENIPELELARAVGGALAVIGTLLNRAGLVTLEELASTLAIYATVSGERNEREGAYLGSWAGVLRELAEARPLPDAR